jgi:hypothetical protein
VSDRHIEYTPIAKVARATNNPKAHDRALLNESITRFGFVEPMVVDERTGQLVAGHGRLDQLEVLETMEAEAPEGVTVADDGTWLVPVIRGWASKDDKEAQAYLIASNRITERGGWDPQGLADALATMDGELRGVGFDQSDVDDLLARLQEAQEVAFQNSRQGEAHTESTYGDWKDNYLDNGVRSIVLDFPIAEFEQIVARATVLRGCLGVDSNAELFKAMVNGWQGCDEEGTT